LDKAIAVIATGLMLLLLFPAVRRIPMSDALRYVVVWLAIFLALGLLYRFVLHPEPAAPAAEPEAEATLTDGIG
jgi:hypothetical protein